MSISPHSLPEKGYTCREKEHLRIAQRRPGCSAGLSVILDSTSFDVITGSFPRRATRKR